MYSIPDYLKHIYVLCTVYPTISIHIYYVQYLTISIHLFYVLYVHLNPLLLMS